MKKKKSTKKKQLKDYSIFCADPSIIDCDGGQPLTLNKICRENGCNKSKAMKYRAELYKFRSFTAMTLNNLDNCLGLVVAEFERDFLIPTNQRMINKINKTTTYLKWLLERHHLEDVLVPSNDERIYLTKHELLQPLMDTVMILDHLASCIEDYQKKDFKTSLRNEAIAELVAHFIVHGKMQLKKAIYTLLELINKHPLNNSEWSFDQIQQIIKREYNTRKLHFAKRQQNT